MLREHAWEQRDQNRGWDLAGWDHDSDDDGMSEQEKAAFEFMELLLQQYFAGVITATTFCILCHWVSKAGLVCEAAAEYSLPPGRSSGKYKAHLDEKLQAAAPSYVSFRCSWQASAFGRATSSHCCSQVQPTYGLIALLMHGLEASQGHHMASQGTFNELSCRLMVRCYAWKKASRPCLMIEGHEDSMGVPGLLMKP